MRTLNLSHMKVSGIWRGLMAVCLAVVGLSLLLESSAFASSLPDGRIYEQVTPPFKNGNYVTNEPFGLAAANGEAVVYPTSGAIGTAYAGMLTEFASHRVPGQGWVSASTTPRPTGVVEFLDAPMTVIPSADFTRFLFTSRAPFVADDQQRISNSGVNIFLSEDAAVEPAWLGRPLISEPLPELGGTRVGQYLVAGASPSLETAYFTYAGTLIPEDASRAPNVAPGYRGKINEPGTRNDDPWGFYEWHDGQLVSAGTLPNGTLSPFGAVPAAIAGQTDFDRGFFETQAATMNNEVSVVDSPDGTPAGSRAFFVSPDPAASVVTEPGNCSEEPPCSPEAPELYMREPKAGGGHVSVLVSGSKLSGHVGEAAPDGVVAVPNAYTAGASSGSGTDAFTSPDGSHVFFASKSRLTEAAPEDETAKEYDYDVESESLTYLPGVSGPIALSSTDGSELLFENRAASPWQVELWRSGAGGGSVTPIAQLPGSNINLDSTRESADGSVFVFRTNAAVPGFNDAGGFEQIYRYDTSAAELRCLSCPAAGIAPSGNAHMTYDSSEGSRFNSANGVPSTTIETRGISSDGSRVFFDTPSSLVTQDINETSDVYEWESGSGAHLISSGTSTSPSTYLDNDVSGENVFFATSTGLVPGDNDEAYDVYDARIPRPGDNPPPAEVPCKGSVCQGPPSVPQLLGAPASETFSGVGNLTPTVKAVVKGKAKVKAKKKAKKKAKSKVRAKKKGKSKVSGKKKGHGKRATAKRAQRSEGRGKQSGHHDRRGK